MPNVMAALPNIGGALCESSIIAFLYHVSKFGRRPLPRVRVTATARVRLRVSYHVT